MKRRISKKLVWDNRGVSEVIGTILMLAITVVLFSSITVWVSNLPAPQGRVYVEMEGSIVPSLTPGGWSDGGLIELKHVGGMELNNWWTVIILEIDGTTTVLDMENSTLSKPPLGDFWEVNEIWYYTVGANILTEDSEVKINIIDQDVDTQVWEGTLMGTGTWFEPIIMDVWIDSDLATIFADPGPIEYGPEKFTVFAQIVDPEGDDPTHGLDVSTVELHCSMLGWSNISMTDDNFDNIFTATIVGPDGNYSAGYYLFTCTAMDHSGRAADPYKVKFALGGEIGGNPQIVVYGNNKTATNIWTVPANPLNGDVVMLYSRIRNLGGAGGLVDIKFYDGGVEDANLTATEQELINFGDYIVSTSWEARPGGIHNISVNATVNETWSVEQGGIFEPDGYLNDNQNCTDIVVLPTILLVDDDAHMNDGSIGDTSTFMRASLETSDFDYDFTIVSTGGNGPAFDSGDYRLEEYDIVIWMTGYETTNTIRGEDETNLVKFLENGGSLWLIGEGAFMEAGANPTGTLNLFLNSELYTKLGTTAPLPHGSITVTDDHVQGVFDHKVTDEFYEKKFNLVEKIAGYNHGYYIEPLELSEVAFALNGTHPAVPALATSRENGPDEGRILVQAFEFSMIDSDADMVQLAYKAIIWLGDITQTFGRDLAVSEQYMSPSRVFYKQPVTITGVIRNNGFQNETYVNWSMTITDALGKEIQQNKSGMTGGAPDPINGGPIFIGMGTNNSATITVMWTPKLIGAHTIVFMVDPDNQIIETNEHNNVLSDRLSSGDVDVQYIILVVDDSQGSSYNEIDEVTNALDNLTYDYDYYNVALEFDSPGFNLLSNYNAVIWVCGDVDEPWADADVSIQDYLEKSHGNFWLTGQNCLGSSVNSSLEINTLQLLTMTEGQTMPSTLYGVDNTIAEESVSHGMKYETNGAHGCDILTNTSLSRGMFYQDIGAGNFNAVRYENTDYNYRSVVNTFNLNSINSSEAKQELVYLILHWFDKPDVRTELRITDSDVHIRNSRGPMTHPQIGDAYILQATVYNPGGTEANFMVRFLDGDTQIGSDSIGISPNGKTTAEVVWIPLYAGQRNINVVVDPPDLHEADEIFETFNNYATKPIYVYFFWDDMENGTTRWSHSSTVMLINGESPLDYFTETELYTDITTDWNVTMTTYLNETSDLGFYNSFDKAYWLQEPAGAEVVTRKPIDVVFALDTSGSMSDEIDELVIAVNQFLGNLTEGDRAAIWKFNGTGSDTTNAGLYEPYRYCTPANITYLQGQVSALDPVTGTTYTPFYDTLGSAIQYSQTYLIPDRLEYVVGMTDGESNSDDVYTPNANWGLTVAGDNTYSSSTPHPTQGLLYPPAMVYTIGLGLDTTPDGDPSDEHDPDYPVAPAWSRISPLTQYSMEYDVWHCADSSPKPLHDFGGKYGENASAPEPNDNVGHYYYTNDSSQLPGIFDSIFKEIQQSIVESENVTRAGGNYVTGSPGPLPEPYAASLYNYVGVTRATNDHYAWFLEVNSASDVEFKNPISSPEFTDTQYGEVNASDNSRASSFDPGQGDEVFTMSTFNITETPADIIQIDMTIEIQGDANTDFQIWAYNDNTSAWTTIGGSVTAGADIDVAITRSITENCSKYINATTGYFTWGCYQTDDSSLVRVDYMEVLIIHIAGGINIPPNQPSNPNPADSTGGVSTSVILTWTCTDPDDGPYDLNFTIYLGTTNPPPIAGSSGTAAAYDPGTLAESTIYYWFVLADDGFNTVSGPVWIFATSGEDGGGGGALGDMGLSPDGPNYNKTAVTDSVDLRNLETATLSFWHKYNMVSGVNGGVLMVGYKESAVSPYKFKYIIPSSAYTGNMRLTDLNRTDDFGAWMRWGWNGVSTRGTFNWEKVSMNILPHIPDITNDTYEYRSNVSVKFAYYQYGGGTGYGWYIDDVRIEVSRSDISDPVANTADVWNHTTNDSHSGDWSWSNVDPVTGHMKAGIDNSLMTNPIDLTNARWAELSAYFKFNINTQDGAPPDGFRVEITEDNGVIWQDLTLGVRSAWGVSGSEADDDDGNPGDGKSYSGLNPDNYWVEAGTLTRLNIDLTPYSGNAIQIRFRVVTTLTDPPTAYEHFEDDTVGFGGFWVDDVIVRGETTNVYG